jgi:hypothetical protein
MRLPQNKALNTSRSGSFGAGRGFASPASDQDAGGANLSKSHPTQQGDAAFNKGRLSGGTAVHHNGGTHGIPNGNTGVPPR